MRTTGRWPVTRAAGLHPADFADELPVIALTCIDPRLNAFFPNALALPAEQFIWLRNAGNIITGPLSSTMRSLALACAVKGGKEIAIIGHTDCQICKTTAMQLLDKLKALGVERHLLPDNLNEFFGMFGSERQNVIKACDIVRHSPLIGPKIPGAWSVGGHRDRQARMDCERLRSLADVAGASDAIKGAGPMAGALGSFAAFNIGEMKFPEAKIGELATKAEDWLSQKVEKVEAAIPGTPETKETVAQQVAAVCRKALAEPAGAQPSTSPPKIPLPPPIRPKIIPTRGRR